MRTRAVFYVRSRRASLKALTRPFSGANKIVAPELLHNQGARKPARANSGNCLRPQDVKKKTRERFAGLFATGQNRTDDIRIFSPALYQLSYSGVVIVIISDWKKTVKSRALFLRFFLFEKFSLPSGRRTPFCQAPFLKHIVFLCIMVE